MSKTEFTFLVIYIIITEDIIVQLKDFCAVLRATVYTVDENKLGNYGKHKYIVKSPMLFSSS